jgi:hypothetical protein
MHGRQADYLRLTHDLRIPFDNYVDVRVMSMSA